MKLDSAPRHHVNGSTTRYGENSPTALLTPAQRLLENLLASSLLRPVDWGNVPTAAQDALKALDDVERLLDKLVEHKLLSQYLADRVSSGKWFGLVLGNYRVLSRLGAGAMGIVFKGEHLRLPRLVAIKVLPLSPDQDTKILQRFYTEMWAVAQLQHPNIVSAIDAGEAHDSDPGSPVLHYFVMDYVEGQDLEDHIHAHGPLGPATACDLIHQVAAALTEAAKHNLIHRDIKPSNILVTPEGQAKLLDFGLARHFRSHLTEPGTVLGTIDYMAPEQARNASTVDIRADIYGLGGTLFWCLTGQLPFPSSGNPVQDLAARLMQPAPSVRAHGPDLAPELDAVIRRMMAVDPNDRYQTPQALMQALLPFLRPASSADGLMTSAEQAEADPRTSTTIPGQPAAKVHHVLVVDDEPGTRNLCRYALQMDAIQCDEAGNGLEAMEALRAKPYDLLLLDIDMPQMNGAEVLRQVRADPPSPHIKVIMFSGRASSDQMAQMLSAGADDYLTKPLSVVQLTSRVKSGLRLKDAQERSDQVNRSLLSLNHQLEGNLTARDGDLIHARNSLVMALAELVAYRDTETGAHLMRLQRYGRTLAEEAANYPGFTGQIDSNFIEMMECCAPLHDIGKVGLPDHILLKPGKLDPDERIIMQTHTTTGAATLQKVAKQHGFALAFFQMAIDIVRHHHERFDGKGYPDRLAGNDIPLAARIVAVGDVYDALRARRSYKPALSHSAAYQVMIEASPGHFDPVLMQAFERCAPRFERIYRELVD